MTQPSFKVSLHTHPRTISRPMVGHPTIPQAAAQSTPKEAASSAKPARPDVAPRNAAPFAVRYGILGFVAAALILIVGFWPTLLLALFVVAGVLIGRYRDGDVRLRQFMRRFVDRIS